MTDKRYWIWLQMCLGEGARFKEILDDFGSVEKLYNSNILEQRMSPALTTKQFDLLQNYSINDTEQIIYNCENNGWQIITFDDEEYPNRLREIPNPPMVLYVDGKLPDIDNNVAIGIVGTRKASSYAQTVTSLISKSIGLCNTIIVSGGALGVDSSAHIGAMNVGAKTIAVLGCGLGTDYLSKNKQLRNRIKQNGALISEYPPFTPASKFTFPLRNRIISGLSLGILVVEAGVKSGSLITAKYAIEQNRDVYAIPSSLLDPNFSGSNKLIEDGATVVTKPEVLIEGYAEQFDTLDMSKIKSIRDLMYENKGKNANVAKSEKQLAFDQIVSDRRQRVQKQNDSLALVGDEKLAYEALSEAFENIDVITDKCDLPLNRLATALTMLELKGLAESASGKRYKLS